MRFSEMKSMFGRRPVERKKYTKERQTTKGGFIMKPTRLMTVLFILLGMSAMIYAAGTPAGTAITAFATGDYKDVNSNSLHRVT